MLLRLAGLMHSLLIIRLQYVSFCDHDAKSPELILLCYYDWDQRSLSLSLNLSPPLPHSLRWLKQSDRAAAGDHQPGPEEDGCGRGQRTSEEGAGSSAPQAGE